MIINKNHANFNTQYLSSICIEVYVFVESFLYLANLWNLIKKFSIALLDE